MTNGYGAATPWPCWPASGTTWRPSTPRNWPSSRGHPDSPDPSRTTLLRSWTGPMRNNFVLDGLPGDGEFVDAVGLGVVLEPQVGELGGQAQGRDAAEEGAEHDVQLDARQLLADALVRAPAEGDVVRGLAGQVEPGGLGEGRRVPVG